MLPSRRRDAAPNLKPIGGEGWRQEERGGVEDYRGRRKIFRGNNKDEHRRRMRPG